MARILSLLLITAIFICLPGLSYAQSPQPQSLEDYQRQIQLMEQERQKAEQQLLENLKNTDYKAYQEKIKNAKLQEKINEIINEYNQEKISYESAKSQLYYPVRDMLADKSQAIVAELEQLKKKIEDLEKQKRDKSYMINKYIDQMLGRTPPDTYISP